MRRVRQVVSFTAELQRPLFADRELPEQAQVRVEHAGRSQNIPSGVAEAHVPNRRERFRIVIRLTGSDSAEFRYVSENLIGGLGIIGSVK